MNKIIPYTSMAVSLAALTTSLTFYLRADALVDAAVQRREAAMVEKLKPKVLDILGDFDMKDDVREARTLDALFAPLFKIATSIK